MIDEQILSIIQDALKKYQKYTKRIDKELGDYLNHDDENISYELIALKSIASYGMISLEMVYKILKRRFLEENRC